jgi:endo-1,4-beta-xylanase
MPGKPDWDRCMIDRRTVLAGGLAVAAAPEAGIASQHSLRSQAAAKGLVFGAAVQSTDLARMPAYAAALARDCGVIVAENEMKWVGIEAVRGQRMLAGADAIVAFAQANGQALRGHTLVWPLTGRTPAWLVEVASNGAAALEAALVAHIQDLVGRYRGRVRSWDVVNETLEGKDGRSDGLRRGLLLDTLGPGWIDTAFRAAHAADPMATLVYNDYGTEQRVAWKEQKRTMVLRFLEGLLKRRVPVHAFGVQAHLNGVEPFDAAGFAGFLREIAGLGLKIEITELDVDDHALPADISARDRLVAELTGRFLDVCLAERATTSVVTWGVADHLSYLNRAGWAKPRADGLKIAARPLPLDEQLQPKPMWHAIARALAAAPAR